MLALTQDTTQGAITALGQAHETGKVKLATFDASPFQMTGLTTGTIQLTVAQEPPPRAPTRWTRRSTRWPGRRWRRT